VKPQNTGKAPFPAFGKRNCYGQKHYPDVLYLGIAEGAKNNWSFLAQHTSRQLLDFFTSLSIWQRLLRRLSRKNGQAQARYLAG